MFSDKVFARKQQHTEAQRVQPESANPPAHDAITRLLHRMEPSPETLWLEAQQHVSLNMGILVIDDSTLDKFYAEKMELVTRHWSGKHGRVVQGINLISLLWTQGDSHIPLDYRFYMRLFWGKYFVPKQPRKICGWSYEKRPFSGNVRHGLW